MAYDAIIPALTAQAAGGVPMTLARGKAQPGHAGVDKAPRLARLPRPGRPVGTDSPAAAESVLPTRSANGSSVSAANRGSSLPAVELTPPLDRKSLAYPVQAPLRYGCSRHGSGRTVSAIPAAGFSAAGVDLVPKSATGSVTILTGDWQDTWSRVTKSKCRKTQPRVL